MKILAIETSCDETAIAVLKTSGSKKNLDFNLLSNIVASQVEIHQPYGGVYPSLAKREHQRNLVPVLRQALKRAELLQNKAQSANQRIKLQTLNSLLEREPELLKQTALFLKHYQKPRVNALAVTIGPGLEPCLWVGVNFAKALAFWWNLPMIAVDHIEAHILANFLGPNYQLPISNYQKLFPAICLVVSGGHTQLILMKNFGQYRIIGETKDDAAGECYDKTARILGLSYPGGPAIAAEAAKSRALSSNPQVNLPRPMAYSKDYDFSFSGLKTAVLYKVKSQFASANRQTTDKNQNFIRQMASEIQKAINEVLIKKTIKATKDFRAKTIILSGGVAANKQLRENLAKKIKKELPHAEFLVPSIGYCTDNAAMIAIAGFFNQDKKTNWSKIAARADLRLK